MPMESARSRDWRSTANAFFASRFCFHCSTFTVLRHVDCKCRQDVYSMRMTRQGQGCGEGQGQAQGGRGYSCKEEEKGCNRQAWQHRVRGKDAAAAEAATLRCLEGWEEDFGGAPSLRAPDKDLPYHQSHIDKLAQVGRVVLLQSGDGTNDCVQIAEVRCCSMQDMVRDLGADLLPDAIDANERRETYIDIYGARRCMSGLVVMRFKWPCRAATPSSVMIDDQDCAKRVGKAVTGGCGGDRRLIGLLRPMLSLQLCRVMLIASVVRMCRGCEWRTHLSVIGSAST